MTDDMLLGEPTPLPKAVEYEHYSGRKLSQAEFDRRHDDGWTVADHFCNVNDVHTYVFRRAKA